MKTNVTADYLEVELTGNPYNPPASYKDPNKVLENLYTGKIVDAPDGNVTLGYNETELVGKTIVFAKVFKIIVSNTETKYYVHRNAVVAFVEDENN